MRCITAADVAPAEVADRPLRMQICDSPCLFGLGVRGISK